MFDGALKQTEL